MTAYTADPAPVTRSRLLGLPLWVLLALALLGAPRVILHDLDILHEGTPLNLLFMITPPLVWIIVAVAARVPRPFLTLLAVGLFYGLILGLVHQLLWGAAFPGGTPTLGGNLADLDPALQALIVRGAAAVSSVFTGAVVGVLTGLVAEAVRALLRLTGDRR